MLPSTPIPYPDESGASFLIRAASLNGHTSVNNLLIHRYNLSETMRLISDIHNYRNFKRIMELLDIDTDSTKNLVLKYANLTSDSGILFEGNSLPTHLFRTDGTAFCPQCLKEKAYLRNKWRFSPYYGCLIHQTRLINQCPSCGETPSPLRGNILICQKCKFDYSKSEASRINIEPIEYFAKIFKKHNEPAIQDFSHLWSSLWKLYKKHSVAVDLSIMVEIIYEAFCAPEKAASCFFNTFSGVIFKLFELDYYSTFSGNNIFSKRFFDLLSSRLLNSKIDIASIQLSKKEACEILGISHFKLKTLIRKKYIIWPAGEKRGSKINASIITSLQKAILHNSTTPLNTENLITIQHGYYSIKDASDRLLIHEETVRNLIRSSWLKAERMNCSGVSKYIIKQEDMDAFCDKYICVGTIAKQRKLNPTNLAEKLATLNIHPIDGPNINGLTTTLFHRNQIDTIKTDELKSIHTYPTKTGRKPKGHPQPIPKPSSKTYDLKEASRLLDISTQKVATLVRKGILQRERNQQTIAIKSDVVYGFKDMVFGNRFVSVEKASQIAGCTQPWIYINLVNKKIITLIDCIYWKLISIHDLKVILHIRQYYFTSSEASHFLGMHRSHINNLKRLGKITPSYVDTEERLDLYPKYLLMRMKEELMQ